LSNEEDRGPLTLMAMPPKRLVPGSNANYWQITPQILTNSVPVLHATDPSIPVPKEPHWWVEGVVDKVISEADGDHHIWLEFLDSQGNAMKDRLACEITPQQKITPPKSGDKVRIYGILRYDHQHSWWEIHPVDFIEPL
jgi:hypothetical protein